MGRTCAYATHSVHQYSIQREGEKESDEGGRHKQESMIEEDMERLPKRESNEKQAFNYCENRGEQKRLRKMK